MSNPMDQVITEPTEDDITRLAQQVLIVDQLTRDHLGRELAHDRADLDLIQALLDEGVPGAAQTFELQCLGVVLGTLLVDALDGVDWVIVEDEYGRDPAIRYLRTSLLIFPLTMIAKRVEAGEAFRVTALFDGVCAEVARLRGEFGPS